MFVLRELRRKEQLSRDVPKPNTKLGLPNIDDLEPLSTSLDQKLPSNVSLSTTVEPAAAGIHLAPMLDGPAGTARGSLVDLWLKETAAPPPENY